ncbi:MAG: carboxypeptidase regulatory-like domain-containing protein, partial [Candidatus Hydrogenedentes bacterium]|nr:carboxypeptidase regulatory-like domain-containing protein [Candidatus Hydrogenedentota bacterium]
MRHKLASALLVGSILVSAVVLYFILWSRPQLPAPVPVAETPQGPPPPPPAPMRSASATGPQVIEIEAPPPLEGSGTISGYVLDWEARPVAGLEATASRASETGGSVVSRRSGGSASFPTEPPAVTQSATTSEDGAFDITSLPWGSYFVFVCGNGIAASATTMLSPKWPHQSLILTLEAAGALGGTVEDADGDTVSGAWLMPLKHDGEELDYAEMQGLGLLTESEGSFLFVSLAHSAWEFVVKAPGFAPLVTQAISVDTLDAKVVLSRGSPVSGRVVLESDGSPVAGIKVVAEAGAGPEASEYTRTDKNGDFLIAALAPGRYFLFTTGAKFVPIKGPVEIKVPTDRPLNSLEIRVTEGGSVAGRVFDADTGEGIGGVNVLARALQGRLPRQAQPATDSSGRYQLDGLLPGSYTITPLFVNALGYDSDSMAESESRKTVSVSLGAAIEGVDFFVRRDLTVTGAVVDSEGRPLPGADVSERLASGPRSGLINHTRSDKDGGFLFAGFSVRDEVYLSASTLDLKGDRIGPLEIPAEGLHDIRIVLSVRRDAMVLGQVVDQHGRPCPAQVSARLIEGERDPLAPRIRDDTDAEGNFVLTGLSAGEYTLSAGVRNLSFSIPHQIQRLRLAAGEVRRGVRLVVERYETYEITGRVTSAAGEPVVGARVRCSQLMDTPGMRGGPVALSDYQGNYEFDALPAGFYLLEASARGFERQTLMDIEAGTTNADFNLGTRAVIEGRVQDAQSRKPITQFELAVRGETPDPAGTAFESFANPDGMFSLPVENPGKALSLTARASGYVPNQQGLGVIFETVSGIVITLEPGETRVVGRVRDSGGSMVANALIFLGILPSPPSLARPAARTDAAGEFTLENFPSQPTLISAYDP